MINIQKLRHMEIVLLSLDVVTFVVMMMKINHQKKLLYVVAN